MNLPEEKTKEEVKQGLIEMYSSSIEEMKSALYPLGGIALTNTPYIVMVGGIAVDPQVVDGKVEKGQIAVGLPHKVRRFSKKNAEIIAANVTNGNDECGVAVSWVEATKQVISEYENQLSIIKGM